MNEPLRLFWISCGGNRGENFGDVASKTIVELVSGRKTKHIDVDNPLDSELCAVGSLLHLVPGDYSGAIWGSGIIAADYERRYSYARICALRGKKTAKRLNVKDIPLGDPLLLLNKPNVQQKWDVGIVPHYVDWDNDAFWAWAKANENVLVIDPLARDAIDRIATCKVILSSSLHGLVVADAFGIPNQWTIFSEGKISGGIFKFQDYYSALDIDDPIPYRWDKTHAISWILGGMEWQPRKLDDIRHDLLEAFPQEMRANRDWGMWIERTNIIAGCIAPNSSVLELGSGHQLLKNRLRECEYQPCDIKTENGQLFCDFNFGVFPKVTKRYDYIVCSGILEYVNSPREFLQKAFALGDKMILSYALKTPEQTIEQRETNGWVNHLTMNNLSDLSIDLGLRFQMKEIWQDQVIGYILKAET